MIWLRDDQEETRGIIEMKILPGEQEIEAEDETWMKLNYKDDINKEMMSSNCIDQEEKEQKREQTMSKKIVI